MAAIARKERRERLSVIYNARIAQADKEGFTKAMRAFEQEDMLAAVMEAKRRGTRVQTGERTDKEQEVFESQQAIRMSELSPEERAKLQTELDQMWKTVPEEHRRKYFKKN